MVCCHQCCAYLFYRFFDEWKVQKNHLFKSIFLGYFTIFFVKLMESKIINFLKYNIILTNWILLYSSCNILCIFSAFVYIWLYMQTASRIAEHGP